MRQILRERAVCHDEYINFSYIIPRSYITKLFSELSFTYILYHIFALQHTRLLLEVDLIYAVPFCLVRTTQAAQEG